MVLVTESKVSHVGIAKQASRSPAFARELHSHASLLKTRLPIQIWLLTQTPACRIWCHGCNMQIHTDYRNPVEKKGWHDHSLREGERARESLRERETTPPCLDRLLLLFWAHYVEDGPHLLCTGSPQVITF